MARYFTVEEANELLPRLEGWVKKLLVVYEEIVQLHPQIESVIQKSHLNSGNDASTQMWLAFERFERLLKTIRGLGVQVKDPSSGLCDFPALYQGRDIYLCWRYGEEYVEWWHDLHTGLAGRRHVNELFF